MRISLKSTNIDLTDAIRNYVSEKMDAVAKLVDGYDSDAMAEVEVGKSTAHHNKGPYLRCEVNLTFLGNVYRGEEEREDLYEAIDVCKDEVRRQVVERKERAQDQTRGQRPGKE